VLFPAFYHKKWGQSRGSQILGHTTPVQTPLHNDHWLGSLTRKIFQIAGLGCFTSWTFFPIPNHWHQSTDSDCINVPILTDSSDVNKQHTLHSKDMRSFAMTSIRLVQPSDRFTDLPSLVTCEG